MKDEILNFDNINSLAEEITNIISKGDKVLFDNANEFCNSFIDIYNREKLKLPYHVNILDVLWANENAHSRIFVELLKQKNGDIYEILGNFTNYLQTLNSNFKLNVTQPTLTYEKDRIDTLLLDKEYALIVENKIHNAIDQESQLARYIEKVKDKGYKDSDIFVIYLTRDGNKKVADYSWQLSDKDYKQDFKDRFIEISYLNNILPWLKESLLPNCRVKDIYLKSTLEQYIDYFEGLFNKREIHKNMNKELKAHISKTLNLNSSLEENLTNLENKLSDILKVEDQLKALIEETNNECWKEWLKRLVHDFPDYELIDYSNVDKFKKVGVKLEYNGFAFSILIEQDRNIYFGIGRHDSSQELFQEIKSFTKPLIEEFKETERWYGWKYTSFRNGYNRLFSLIKEVERAMK